MTYFNWKDGRLGPAKVLLDKVEYDRVYEAKTGRDGYIRRYLTDARGNIITDEEGVRVERIDGHVIVIFGEK